MRKSALFPNGDKEIVGKNFMCNKLTIKTPFNQKNFTSKTLSLIRDT